MNNSANISNQSSSPNGEVRRGLQSSSPNGEVRRGLQSSSPNGEVRRGLRLTRRISNRSCTIGEMTVEGTDILIYTREDKRPMDGKSYIKHCLPPGVYEIKVEYGVVDIGNDVVRGWWPMFMKVPWFPRAGFCVASNYGCRLGRINIGTDVADEFSLDGADEATKILMRHFVDWNNDDDPVTLTIVEPSDMVIHEYSKDEFYGRLKAEEERQHQLELERQIYNS